MVIRISRFKTFYIIKLAMVFIGKLAERQQREKAL